MSARSKKKTTTTVETHVEKEESQGTPSSRRAASASTPSQQGRSASPSSPLSVSRVEEKEELAHLNDRLSSYIDYVRNLENTKATLMKRIQTYTETQTCEVSNIKKMYEDEVAQLRRAQDKAAKEKAALMVDNKKLLNDYDDMKGKLGKRDAEIRALQKRCEQLEKDLASYKLDHDRYTALQSDYNTLERQFETTRAQLEKETLMRTDLENRVLTLKEELKFQGNLHREEMSKSLERTTSIEEEIEGKKAAEYESQLADQLREYREELNEELEDYRNQIELTFKKKFEEMRTVSDKHTTETVRLRDELMTLRSKTDDVNKELAAKTAELNSLRKRVKDLEDLLNSERRDFSAQCQSLKEENDTLRQELEERFREFNDLMNTKIKLDQEIIMYRRLLEGEEGRLNLDVGARGSPFISSKRRRVEGESGSESFVSRSSYKKSFTSKSDIQLVDFDDTGMFVTITNTSDKEVCIGNWQLTHTPAGKDVTTFKFHRSLHIKPQGVCTVWSAESNTTHNPPTDVVMKGKFFLSNIMKTTLLDADGTEVSEVAMEKDKRSTLQAMRRGKRTGEHDEKCMVM